MTECPGVGCSCYGNAELHNLPTAETGLRQVWCVAYDSPTPSMDGGAHPIRMADQAYEIAVRNYEFMQRQQRVAPKRNLRIETRWVSDYTVVPPPGVAGLIAAEKALHAVGCGYPDEGDCTCPDPQNTTPTQGEEA
jgi:hypothetical protein